MELTAEQLARIQARFPYPRFSSDEYRRRYEKIRAMMRRENVECLLIIGGSAAYGRVWSNLRYVTNMVGKADQAKYAIFPLEGEPRLIVSGKALGGGMLGRCVVRHVTASRDLMRTLVQSVDEVGCKSGRIGIVEYDPKTSIPKNHWDYLIDELPHASFTFVTKAFLALRLLKSDEEVGCLERSSELNDLAVTTLARTIRPGMTEAAAFAAVYEAVVRAGGELGMVQLASAPMNDPDLNDMRPRPVDRVIGPRDFINDEMGVFYNGYEAQNGRPLSTGRPTDALKNMFRATVEAYHAVVETLVPGKTSTDSIRAAQCIRNAGYESYGPFVQGMYGYDPRYEPEFDFPDLRGGQEEVEYREGMVFVVQPHLRDLDATASLFLADTYAITAKGNRCLNALPLDWIEI